MAPGTQVPRPEEALGYIVYSCLPEVMRQEAQPSQDLFAMTVERRHLVPERVAQDTSTGLVAHPREAQVDGVTLETGSFNYTTAAIKHNAENALVLWNVPRIAEVYVREWERLWEESR